MRCDEERETALGPGEKGARGCQNKYRQVKEERGLLYNAFTEQTKKKLDKLRGGVLSLSSARFRREKKGHIARCLLRSSPLERTPLADNETRRTERSFGGDGWGQVEVIVREWMTSRKLRVWGEVRRGEGGMIDTR